MSCMICDRIQMHKDEINPYVVRELETGFVVIGDHQRFKGYTLFMCKQHVTELHLLEENFKMTFLKEMSLVSEACFKAFNADKMNIESLGNGEAHLHFHLFPRVDKDMPIRGPVWWTPKEEMYSEEFVVKDEELEDLKQRLSVELDKLFIK